MYVASKVQGTVKVCSKHSSGYSKGMYGNCHGYKTHESAFFLFFYLNFLFISFSTEIYTAAPRSLNFYSLTRCKPLLHLVRVTEVGILSPHCLPSRSRYVAAKHFRTSKTSKECRWNGKHCSP